jgi:NADH-quinone oxidoreductase subunit L
MNAFGLAPLILAFPVIGVLFNGLVGRRFVDHDREVGEMWAGWFASLMALAAFAVAVLLALSLPGNQYHAVTVPLFDWINIPSANFYVPWAIQVDTLSVTMMLVVTGVGSLIHIYAIGYMHGDQDFSRFFAYLNLFLFFMLILVAGNNYLMLFVGWEGVGLCSFLLIGFWFYRLDEFGIPANANAARKAFVANRVGDFAMVLALILTFWTFGSLTFEPVFESAVAMFQAGQVVQFGTFQAPLGQVLTAITVLFLIGAAGKSAQIPLYVWLPDAMAGPTPVSALIHAATMVTSGIYLIVRSNVLFEIVRESGALLFGQISAPNLVALIGATTALWAGLIAFTQFDIKKVLAYSTISQLGFMIAAAGMGAYIAAMFHLVTHAFFKALLFLGSGSVIHGMEHGHHHAEEHAAGHHPHHPPVHAENLPEIVPEKVHHPDEVLRFNPQDMRNMGGLSRRMKTTFVVYLIGALGLAGIPPLAGFWSKDEILAHAADNAANHPIFWLIFALLALAALGTAFYVGRQLKMVFFGGPRTEAADHASESPLIMTIPLSILAVLTLLGGMVLNFPYLTEAAKQAAGNHPAGTYLMMEQWLEHSIQSFALDSAGVVHLPHTPILLTLWVALGSILIAVAGLALAVFVVYRGRPARVDEPDALQATPIWRLSVLPLDTFYMRGVIPLFNRVAGWMGHRLDGHYWHHVVHDRIVRDGFVGWSRFTNEILDTWGLDGMLVNGAGRLTARLAGVLRLVQTGFVRSYALGVFLGVVLLLAYFVFMSGS